MKIKTIIFLILCFGKTSAQQAVIPLWPDGAPGSEDWTQKEVWYLNDLGQQMVRNVAEPTLTVYLPDPEIVTETAIIVAPGGGFRFLSWETEGTMVAEWLASKGITAFLLKYRLLNTGATEEEFQKALMEFFMQISKAADLANANTPESDISRSESMADITVLGQEDGRQAIRIVRERAEEWRIDPEKVGIMGFSAGGMVTLGTLLGNDPDSRPDFAGAIYTPWSGQSVTDDAPPLFILVAADDGIAANGSIEMYKAWKAAGKEAELHIYSKGGHGFGMQKQDLPCDDWIERFGDWLKQIIMN